jgi:hypothetical protein
MYKVQDKDTFFTSPTLTQLYVKVDIYTECPTKVNVVGIVVGVVMGIIVIGLAVLITWKVFTTIKDKRELVELIRETKNPKWEIVSC